MMNFKNNKGITLIALIVTIVVLLILAGMSISGGISGIEQANDNKLLSELSMVQHAVTERYTKYKLTRDISLLVGIKQNTLPTSPEGKTWIKNTNYNELPDDEKYYQLESSSLNNLGITDVEDTYIVNYKTGETYNVTQKKLKGNNNEIKVLYKSLD